MTNDGSSEQSKVAKVLGFFGVPVLAQSAAQFRHNFVADEISSKVRLFCSSDIFWRLLEDIERSPIGIRQWQEQVHSAFIYAGTDVDALRKLARKLTGDKEAALNDMNRSAGDMLVSDGVVGFCGVMAGVSLTPSDANVDHSFLLYSSTRVATNIISIGQGAVFSKLEYQGIAVFFSTTKEIIDLDARISTGVFDVRDHVLSAVPIVSYVRWAFTEHWHAPEINASLVVDDPVLKQSYGFLNFQEFLSLMRRHRFSTNVAFIPWNWRRSSPAVVRLFRENPEAYSISVHGCDHTSAEFGSSDRQLLCWKAKQALARMDLHESRTGVHHDRVMVFPQGVFSEAAMSVLKQTDLIAMVNNDTISVDLHPLAITTSDVWDIAVMRYSDFPIFTRRYPWEGIENFAFDALLGKPAIIVIHHDFCGDGCLKLIDFVDRMNALRGRLNWRSLGEVVSRSCRQRELLAGVMEVEMYGTELRVQNPSGQPKHFVIRKREHDPSAIKCIHAGSRQLSWKFSGSQIDFELELKAYESTTVRIKFYEIGLDGRSEENLSYKIQTMMRRYLSEVRDNYGIRHMPSFVSRRFKVN